MREAFDLLIGIRGNNDGIQNKSHCLGRAEEEDITLANQKRFVTPVGIAKFPWLTTPDTRFNKDGEYRVSLLLDPSDPEAQEFLAKLDELHSEAIEKIKQDLISQAKNPKLGERIAASIVPQEPYREELDQEGEPTGRIEVRFKSKAKFTRKDGTEVVITPRIFDAKAKPWDLTVPVYGGSKIRVNFTPNPYYVAATKAAGISLQLNAVQVLEAAQRGGDAGFYGFSAEVTDDEEEFPPEENGGFSGEDVEDF